jgi:hypothetical protein
MRALTHLKFVSGATTDELADALANIPSLRSLAAGRPADRPPAPETLARLDAFEWMGYLAPILGSLGRVTELACDAREEAAAIAAWPGLARIRSLRLLLDVEVEDVMTVLDSPHLAAGTLRELQIPTYDFDPGALRELGKHPALAGLHHLRVEGGAPEGFDGVPRLVWLDVSGPLDAAGARRLLEHPRLARVRSGNGVTPDAHALLKTRFPPVDWSA